VDDPMLPVGRGLAEMKSGHLKSLLFTRHRI
jgi:hypothetical protein